ncbi:variant erythrocyte surface antigen-1 family protein, partial [Babesia divergens]
MTGDLKTQLNELAKGLGSFIGYSNGGSGIGNNGTGGYASSYSNATWEKLCENCKCKSVSNSSSHSCSCGSKSVSSVCEPSDCCADCNVRAAARVFLCFLPCMWYALDYLYKQCNGGGWKNFKIKDNSSLTSLGSFFAGMGYEIGKLDETKTGQNISRLLSSHIFKDSSKPLEKLYEKSKNYFTSSFTSHVPSSDSKPKDPLTVREMLLWLSGLPFTSGFKDLLDHCKGLCSATKNSVQFNDFKSYLFNSCFLSPFVLGAIEVSKSNESEGFPLYKSEWQKFLYPSDSSALADMLFEYLRKMFVPLKFLSNQCKTDKDSAGWKDCAFGQSCVKGLKSSLSTPAPSGSVCCKSSGPHGILCTSVPGHSNYHEHCTSSKTDVKCIGLQECNQKTGSDPTDAHSQGKCTASCPHPLLMFLIDGSLGSDPAKSYSLFRLPKDSSVPPMGFSPDNLPTPGRHGEALYLLLEAFSTVSFLTTLLKFELHVSRTPPETLGELFGFFLQFKDSPVFSSGVLQNLFETYIKEEPGQYSAQKFTNALKTALETLKGSSHSSSHSGSHPYDLFSLHGCDGPKGSGASPTCGPYLYPLTDNVAGVFTPELCSMYLSWICYLPKDFKDRLEEFKQKFSDCCSSGSCQKIVECPCALPLIYSRGFQFMSPNTLNCPEHDKHTPGKDKDCTRRTCKDFIAQLGKVLGLPPNASSDS